MFIMFKLLRMICGISSLITVEDTFNGESEIQPLLEGHFEDGTKC